MIAKLRTLCRSWGGDLIEVSTEEYAKLVAEVVGFYEAPFSSKRLIGVLWGEKKIIYTGPVLWADVIHEMAHVFACQVPPDESDELAFIGWEVALARYIKGPLQEFLDANEDYAINNDGFPLGGLPMGERVTLLQRFVRDARRVGLLGKRNAPRTLR